jgi:hypothetical protein
MALKPSLGVRRTPVQADAWFHPRWRSGSGKLKVEIEETPERLLTARLVAIDPADAGRAANLDGMFHVSEFWSRHIEDELRLIGSQVSDLLREERLDPTETNVRLKLQGLATLKRREIGKRGLAICHHALYAFAANNVAIVADIARECAAGNRS